MVLATLETYQLHGPFTFLCSEDASQSLSLLPSRPPMSWYLDQHVGIGKIKGIVSNLQKGLQTHSSKSADQCTTCTHCLIKRQMLLAGVVEASVYDHMTSCGSTIVKAQGTTVSNITLLVRALRKSVWLWNTDRAASLNGTNVQNNNVVQINYGISCCLLNTC